MSRVLPVTANFHFSRVLLDVSGAVDELNSPSSRLTVGRVMKAGSGCFDVVVPVAV